MNVGILAHVLVIKHARTWLVHISAKNQFQVCYTGNIYTCVAKIRSALKQNIFEHFLPLQLHTFFLQLMGKLIMDHVSSLYFTLTEITCDENAISHEINDVTECFCKLGFHGDGLTCTGIYVKNVLKFLSFMLWVK